MNYTSIIKWLAKQPAPYALGLLFWGEITVITCSLAGGWLLARFLVEIITPFRPTPVFIGSLAIYFAVFYFVHFIFSHNSLFFEGLINIHRHGGFARVEKLYRLQKIERAREKSADEDEIFDPFAPPDRIRASAENFKLRYFLILPTGLVLYLMAFASTIYRLFLRQVLAWESGMLLLSALLIAVLGSACFLGLMSWLPGYISVRRLLGYKTPEGE